MSSRGAETQDELAAENRRVLDSLCGDGGGSWGGGRVAEMFPVGSWDVITE